MSLQNNPFVRGYSGLHVQRVLEVVTDENHYAIFLPLHPSQTHLRDHEVTLKSCIVLADQVVITEGQNISDELRGQRNSSGFAKFVHYMILADENGQSVRLGDTHTREQADEIVRRLTFRTGLYSRCWEISSWHLDRAALDYLARVADGSLSLPPFCQVFRLPDDIVGTRLIGTPWNDVHLWEIDASTVAGLRQQHREHGMPRSLMHVLYLAAEADVRILIFDGGAARLNNLPTYDHD
jgi:hypothetical protein